MPIPSRARELAEMIQDSWVVKAELARHCNVNRNVVQERVRNNSVPAYYWKIVQEYIDNQRLLENNDK